MLRNNLDRFFLNKYGGIKQVYTQTKLHINILILDPFS